MAAAILKLMATPRRRETRGDTIFGGRRGETKLEEGVALHRVSSPGPKFHFSRIYNVLKLK